MIPTAMQLLVNKMTTVINEHDNDERTDFINGYKHALKCVISDIELQMMAIEKEQISKAYETGLQDIPNEYCYVDGNEYYSETFTK